MKSKFFLILSTIFYYTLIILGSIYNFIFGLLGNSIIVYTSVYLFYLLYLIFPIFLLLLPILLYFKLRSQIEKIIIYSYIALVIFIILFSSIFWGINGYFSKFSKEKWLNYISNRYCMIDDIENNYNFTGKNKDEVIQLLGDNCIKNEENSTIMYPIHYSLISVQYYILYYENDIIINTEIDWLD